MNVRLHDSTLRGGEESPGATMSACDRLGIAQALAAAGVDTIEAGFPAAAPRIAASVAEIAAGIRDASVAAFARLRIDDVDLAWAAVRHAVEPRLVTSMATSDDHLNVNLRTTRPAALESIDRIVRRCETYTSNVTFVAEDATRSDREFLVRALDAAAIAGAGTVVIADTVGFMQPEEYAALITYVKERLPGSVVLAARCSDDLGLAVANTLAAVRAGADEVHVAVNGIGARAGLCALEEVTVALRVRADYYDARTQLRTEHLADISALVARASDMPVAKNKAVVGKHAFLHEAGSHQAAVLKQHSLYEVIPAEIVGRSAAQLHFGRNSGRHAIAARCKALGIGLTPAQLETAYHLFLSVAHDSRNVTDAQLMQIAMIATEIELRSNVLQELPFAVPEALAWSDHTSKHAIHAEFTDSRNAMKQARKLLPDDHTQVKFE